MPTLIHSELLTLCFVNFDCKFISSAVSIFFEDLLKLGAVGVS